MPPRLLIFSKSFLLIKYLLEEAIEEFIWESRKNPATVNFLPYTYTESFILACFSFINVTGRYISPSKTSTFLPSKSKR